MPTLPEHVRRHAAACCAAAGVPCPTFADAQVSRALLLEGWDESRHPRGEGGKWAAVGAHLVKAHPFPPPRPPEPPGLGNPKMVAADPKLAAALKASDEHTAAYHRAYTAALVHRLLNRPPEAPAKLPPPEAPRPKKLRAFEKAREALSNASSDVDALRIAPQAHAAVAASHPEAPAALDAARAEARRRYDVALANAEAHLAGLPNEDRHKGWRMLSPLRLPLHESWDESQHPRGQPDNAGEFASTPGGGEGDVEIHDPASGEVFWRGPRAEGEQMLKDQDELEPGHGLKIRAATKSQADAEAERAAQRRADEQARGERIKDAERVAALKTGKGIRPGHPEFVPPPATLYHATFAAEKIQSEGFKSSDELGAQTLGGSAGDLVSFTTKENAEVYRDGLNLARSAARGELSDEALIDAAPRFGVSPARARELLSKAHGDGARRSFEFFQSVSMEGKKFPLFMGGNWPEHLQKAPAAALVSIPSAGIKDVFYNPAEKEWRVRDFKGVRATLREALAALPRRLLALPDVRQRGNFDCGAAAAMSVARYFGVGPEDEADYVAALGTTREGGTSPAQLVAFLGGLGLAVSEAHGMRLADLRDAWARGEPVLCPIQDYGSAADEAAGESGHWVAVVGLGLGFVFLQDPSADNALAGSGSGAAPGLVMVAAADWLAAWHDTDAAGEPFVRYGIAVGPPRLREGFDPAEARDESGEWTKGGGGGGSKPVRDDLTTRRKALSDKDTHNRIHGRTVATVHLADSALQGDAGYRRLERRVAGVISERGWPAHFVYRVDFPQADVYYRGEHRAVISAAEGGGFEIERGSVGYNRRAVLPPGASDADVRAALHKVMGLKRPPPLREDFGPAEARD